MILLSKSKEEILNAIITTREELVLGKNPILDFNKNNKLLDYICMINISPGFKNSSMHSSIKFYKNSTRNNESPEFKSKYINIWKLPEVFEEGYLLIDTGEKFNKDSKSFKDIYSMQYNENVFNKKINFRIKLTNAAINYLQKHIDKRINLNILDDQNIELVSISKHGATIINKINNKYNNKYILTPLGLISYTRFTTINDLYDFYEGKIENLLNINLSKGWTENKIFKLSQSILKDMDM